MLAIFSILLYGVLLLMFATTFLVIFFKLLLMTLTVLRSVAGGALIIISCVAAAAVGYLFLTPAIRTNIPAFNKPGDGGWGIGVDLVAQSATQVLPPIVAATLVAIFVFITVIRFRSSEESNI